MLPLSLEFGRTFRQTPLFLIRGGHAALLPRPAGPTTHHFCQLLDYNRFSRSDGSVSRGSIVAHRTVALPTIRTTRAVSAPHATVTEIVGARNPHPTTPPVSINRGAESRGDHPLTLLCFFFFTSQHHHRKRRAPPRDLRRRPTPENQGEEHFAAAPRRGLHRRA